MFRTLLAACIFVFLSCLRAQTISFTIHTISSSNSITCTEPSVNFVASTAYTGSVWFLWQSQTYTFTGSSVSINQPGTYSVIAFGTNTQSAHQLITVGINTVVLPSNVVPTTQTVNCPNAMLVQVNASSTIAATHIFLSPYGAPLSLTTTAAVYKPGAPGTYTHVVVNNSNGCMSSGTFTFFSAGGFPNFSLATTNNFILGCGPTSVATVSVNNGATSSGLGTVSYTLLGPSLPASPIAGTLSSIPVYSVYAPGNYTIVTRDNTTLCDTRVPFTVTQNTVGPDLKIIVPGQTVTCRMPLVQLLATSSHTNTVYNWSWPGNPGGTSNPTLPASSNPASASNTIVNTYTLQGFNDINQCSSSRSITIYQNIFKPIGVISRLTNTLTCSSPTILLNNLSYTGIPPNNFPNGQVVRVTLWDPPLPQNQATSGATYPAYTSGVYTVYVLDENNGCRDTANIPIYDARVYPMVSAPPTPFCLNTTVTALNIYPLVTGAGQAYTFSWAAPISSLQLPATNSVSVNGTGIYTVSVTSKLSGCTSIGQIIVLNCITGLSETNDPGCCAKIYPNPGTGLFTLVSDQALENISVHVYNTVGKLVKHCDVTSRSTKVDLGNYSGGIYFVHIVRDNTTLQVIKVIKY